MSFPFELGKPISQQSHSYTPYRVCELLLASFLFFIGSMTAIRQALRLFDVGNGMSGRLCFLLLGFAVKEFYPISSYLHAGSLGVVLIGILSDLKFTGNKYRRALLDHVCNEFSQLSPGVHSYPHRFLRANRQLATVLRTQGLNEEADRFAYRAQVLQKRVSWFQMLQPKVLIKQRIQAFGALLFSWFLFLLAGYGYKPGRSFLAYLLVIVGFATTYYLLGSHLAWNEAIVISMTAFL